MRLHHVKALWVPLVAAAFWPVQVAAQNGSGMHPPVTLLDANGANVLASKAPVSPMQTCGACHDTQYIATHTLHDAATMDRLGSVADVVSGPPPEPGTQGHTDMNCFLCHLPNPSQKGRIAALEDGHAEWAATATLEGTGIVSTPGGRWVWNRAAFDGEGRVLPSLLSVERPLTENCANCHGIAGTSLDEPVVLEHLGSGDRNTLARGEIISPQRISASGINIEGKASLTRAWDVHAERLLECSDCHHSTNNPSFRQEGGATLPDGLISDGRKMPLGVYLKRPSHEFLGEAGDLSCRTCHDPGPTHQWLPYADRHLAELSCEACHTPKLNSVAVESVDWTSVSEDGNPQVTYRGASTQGAITSGDLVDGFEPVLLPRTTVDGETRLYPYNLVTSWSWVAGDPAERIAPASVRSALDAAGVSASGEADSDAVAKSLVAMGFHNPRVTGEIRPYGIHHGVATGPWATSECSTCHAKSSPKGNPMVLAESAPAGVIPSFVSGSDVQLPGAPHMDASGRLVYQPESSTMGLYVLGHDGVRWANVLGLLTALGVLAGVLFHAGLRWFSRLRRRDVDLEEAREVYMYTVYQRFWHWVQALGIFGLILTGLEIHFGFRFLGFQTAVQVHNILGFVVVANAIFAALYHVVSGEIQEFMPRPQGFFHQAIVQARYYVYGIFRGEPHPFAKTPGQKLNPLQQVTYLMILNVLLPLQIITGILVWGAQRWPGTVESLGGLPVLAPVHAFGAWMFAAFLLLHVYLTTTGPTPLSAIRGMVVGWEKATHPTDEVEAS